MQTRLSSDVQRVRRASLEFAASDLAKDACEQAPEDLARTSLAGYLTQVRLSRGDLGAAGARSIRASVLCVIARHSGDPVIKGILACVVEQSYMV